MLGCRALSDRCTMVERSPKLGTGSDKSAGCRYAPVHISRKGRDFQV